VHSKHRHRLCGDQAKQPQGDQERVVGELVTSECLAHGGHSLAADPNKPRLARLCRPTASIRTPARTAASSPISPSASGVSPRARDARRPRRPTDPSIGRAGGNPFEVKGRCGRARTGRGPRSRSRGPDRRPSTAGSGSRGAGIRGAREAGWAGRVVRATSTGPSSAHWPPPRGSTTPDCCAPLRGRSPYTARWRRSPDCFRSRYRGCR